MQIRAARFPDDAHLVRTLFREYADWLGVDLSFQRFEEELASLPGTYAEPDGEVLLAANDGDTLGCVAFRPLEGFTCEMKRLWVRPQALALYLRMGYREIEPYYRNPLPDAVYLSKDIGLSS